MTNRPQTEFPPSPPQQSRVNPRKKSGSSRMDLLLVLFLLLGNLFWVPFAYTRWGVDSWALITLGGGGEVVLIIAATLLAFVISVSISFRRQREPTSRETRGEHVAPTSSSPETVYKNVVFGASTVFGIVILIVLAALGVASYLEGLLPITLGLAALLLMAIPVVAVLPRALRQAAITVPQQEVWIVYRLGKFARALHEGPRLLVPWIEQVVKHVELRWDRIEIAANKTPTKDKIPVDVPGILLWQPDPNCPEKHFLKVRNIGESLKSVAETSLRQIASVSTIEELLEAAPHTVARLNKIMLELVEPWGLKIALRISDVILPPELTTAISAEKQAKFDAAARKARSDADAYVQQQYYAALKAQYPKASEQWIGESALYLAALDAIRNPGQSGGTINLLPLGNLLSRKTVEFGSAGEQSSSEQGGGIK